jgi:hypothetical protein
MTFKVVKSKLNSLEGEEFIQYLSQVPDGTKLIIEIGEDDKNRMIRKLYLWLGKISNETGNSVEDLKVFFKDKFSTKDSLSKLTKEEMIHFMNAVKHFSWEELNIILE